MNSGRKCVSSQFQRSLKTSYWHLITEYPVYLTSNHANRALCFLDGLSHYIKAETFLLFTLSCSKWARSFWCISQGCFGVLVFHLIHSPLDSTLNVKSNACRLSKCCLKALCVFSKESLKTRNGAKKTTGVCLEDHQRQLLVGELWQVSMGRVYLYPLQHPV